MTTGIIPRLIEKVNRNRVLAGMNTATDETEAGTFVHAEDQNPPGGDTTKITEIIIAASDSSDADKLLASRICDGTTDAATIIQAVTDVATYGEIELKAGTYYLDTTIRIVKHMWLYGEDKTTTILKPLNDRSDNYAIHLQYASLSDVGITKNGANEFGYGVSANDGAYINNCNVSYSTHYGAFINDAKAEDCSFTFCDVGVSISTDNVATLTNCTCDENVTGLTMGDGVCFAVRSSFDSNTGIGIDNNQGLLIAWNCTVSDNTSHGLDCYSAGKGIVLSCAANDNGGNGYVGCHIVNGSATGNTGDDFKAGCTGVVDYAIYEAGLSQVKSWTDGNDNTQQVTMQHGIITGWTTT